jgi:dihydropteroate synthase
LSNTGEEHRLRVLLTHNQEDLIREMRDIGVDPEGIALMSPKGRFQAVRVDGLPTWNANLIKQEMLALGGEAAVHRGAIDCSAASSSVLILGTQKHFRHLLDKLKKQPTQLRLLGEEIAQGLANYMRRDFTLRLGSSEVPLGKRALVMGIVNVTPDSFYDGGRYSSIDRAVEHGCELADEGADILDIGGESSRRGAVPVPSEVERSGVVPVIEALAARTSVPISVDTCKAVVAKAALEAGAVMVNDISGLRFDPELVRVVAEAGAALIVMHMQGDPRTMQIAPKYGNLMGEIIEQLREALAAAAAGNVGQERILVDPGIGFGKKLEHNLHLIRHLSELRVLGRPIVIGPSRKSFLGAVSDLPVEERLEGTIAAACLGVAAGAHIVRVHDVRAVRRAVEVASAVCRGAA